MQPNKIENVQQNVSYQIPGLTYQKVLGDGHCLLQAVELYVNEDQAFPRSIVAAHLKNNIDYFGASIVLAEEEIIENNIQAIREGKKWADDIEIEVLMRVLNRPIVVNGPDLIILQKY